MHVAPKGVGHRAQRKLISPGARLLHVCEEGVEFSRCEEVDSVIVLPRPHVLDGDTSHVVVPLLRAKELVRQRPELAVAVIRHLLLLEAGEAQPLVQQFDPGDNLGLARGQVVRAAGAQRDAAATIRPLLGAVSQDLARPPLDHPEGQQPPLELERLQENQLEVQRRQLAADRRRDPRVLNSSDCERLAHERQPRVLGTRILVRQCR
mmetsp:Transcript_26177/g.84539  ORF Transcript_26177/g.84539 Transcript_26177/m.84539 type:complete len:207 (-) Transcript_26177:229-849(-)